MRTHTFTAITQVLEFKKLARVFSETHKQMQQAQLLMVAASLAYTSILSIIPLLAVSFAIFKAFGGMERIYSTVEPLVLSNLAEGTGEEMILALKGFINNAHTGAVGIGGFLGLMITSMSMLFSAEKAINQVWQTKMTSSVFHRISSYWLFITLGPLALSIAVGIATFFQTPLEKLLPSGTAMFILSVFIFFSVYKWVPHISVRWPFAMISSVVTASLLNLARIGYAYYAKNAVSYRSVYGSLGAVPILLLWIYILWVILLGGAAFTAALQKIGTKKPHPSDK